MWKEGNIVIGDRRGEKMLKMRRRQVKRRAIAFLIGHKVQTDKGVKRANDLINAIRALYKSESRIGWISLDRLQKLSTALNGLFGYMRGDEKGLIEYERLKTEDILRQLILEVK